MGKKKKTVIEYLFDHGEVINYTLDGISIHPITIKMQASFLTQLTERKENHHEANGDFKSFAELSRLKQVFPFLLILKNSPVFATVKYTHTMMQPPPCLNIRRQLHSDVVVLD